MKLWKFFVATVMCGSLAMGTAYAADNNEGTVMPLQQQVNDQAVLALLWMQRSAEYQACSYQAYNALKTTILEASQEKGSRKQAIILDIDETILDNTPYKAKSVGTTIGKARGAFSKWVAKEKAEVLPGAVKTLQLAHKKDIELFYVSSRSAKKDMEATINNLKKYGIPNADEQHLFLYTGNSNKEESFAKIEKQYEVIAYVGDNLLDFPLKAIKASEAERATLVAKNSAKFGKKFIILPNPDYGSWEYVLDANYKKLSPAEVLQVRKQALKIEE